MITRHMLENVLVGDYLQHCTAIGSVPVGPLLEITRLGPIQIFNEGKNEGLYFRVVDWTLEGGKTASHPMMENDPLHEIAFHSTAHALAAKAVGTC